MGLGAGGWKKTGKAFSPAPGPPVPSPRFMIEAARKQLYNSFNPDEPLEPDDPRYLDCDDVRYSTDLMQELSESIRFSDKPTCQFLSRHRGCGKTSELYRLRQLLSEDSEYFVVYCEATDYLELNDAEDRQVGRVPAIARQSIRT